MPTYLQRCKKCLHEFEVDVPLSEFSKAQPCPQCKASTTIRVLSASSHILKGAGWAKDGYSKK